MSELTRAQAATPDIPAAERQPSVRADSAVLLSAVFAIGLAAFLAIEPSQDWLLLLLCALVALGLDGVLRSHPHANRLSANEAVLHLALPTVFTLVAGVFLEDNVGGYWAAPAGLAMGLPFAVIVNAQYHSLDREISRYHEARLALNAAAYITVFLLYNAVYDFDLNLFKAAIAVGLVSLLMAAEILREDTVNIGQTLIYAAGIGFLAAQTAWTLHYLPLEGSAAAVFLILGFYAMTGVLHHYLKEDMTATTTAEFLGIAAVGLLMVILSRAFL